jgi:hypothetical protein
MFHCVATQHWRPVPLVPLHDPTVTLLSRQADSWVLRLDHRRLLALSVQWAYHDNDDDLFCI